MRFLFLLYFTTLFNSWSLDVIEKFIPQSGSVEATVSVSTTGDLTSTSLHVKNGIGLGIADPEIQVWRTNSKVQTILAGSTSDGVGAIELGSQKADANNEEHGVILFAATSQSTNHKHIAAIEALTSGATSNQRGGRLDFRVKTDGSTGDSVAISIIPGGDVGFGTASPGYNIEAANGAVAGNGAYVDTSDKRLKKDQENVSGACSILDELQPLYYNWKSTVPSSYRTWANGFEWEGEDGPGTNIVDKQPHGQKDIGFFAQDVEPHFPQAVKISTSGRYNLQYQKFIPLLVACINEMRITINDLGL